VVKVLIFDFDGVLQDTFEFHRSKVSSYVGFEVDAQVYRDMHNGNFFDCVPEELKKVNWYGYRSFVFNEMCRLVMDDKLRDYLAGLSSVYDLYIVSSGSSKIISKYLGLNGASVFKEVFGAEECRSKKEKFSMLFEKYGFSSSDCLFITDTVGDVLEAKEVGVKSVCVDFGFHSREVLEKGEPEAIVSSFDELTLFLENLIFQTQK